MYHLFSLTPSSPVAGSATGFPRLQPAGPAEVRPESGQVAGHGSFGLGKFVSL